MWGMQRKGWSRATLHANLATRNYYSLPPACFPFFQRKPPAVASVLTDLDLGCKTAVFRLIAAAAVVKQGSPGSGVSRGRSNVQKARGYPSFAALDGLEFPGGGAELIAGGGAAR